MRRNHLLILFALATALISCSGEGEYSPKPKGYFRIIYPAKTYTAFPEKAPFTFEYPEYAEVTKDLDRDARQYWFNLVYPQFNGRVHLTYYPMSSIKDYEMMVEDARRLAFKHTVKASAIDQQLINYPNHKVYGVYYEIDGNTASSVQFFLTDSVKHYFRGALYFNERPQYDSIAPVIAFIKKDIDKMISTFKWNDEVKATPAARNPKRPAQRPPLISRAEIKQTSGYYGRIETVDSPATVATGFFKKFIAGEKGLEQYLDEEFIAKVPASQLESVRNSWISQYGSFTGIGKFEEIAAGNNTGVRLMTSFERAKPVFTITVNAAGKVIGFFKMADNFVNTYKDPEYVPKDSFTERDIRVITNNFELPGTLTLPVGGDNFPLVVFVHGSGPNDRDETAGVIKTFRDLALGLAAKGVASIRYDKRTKVYAGKAGTTINEETVEDAVSAVKLAGTIAGVNQQKIYLLGHSLGAMMAPRIALSAPELDGVITLGNPAREFADLLEDQFTYLYSLAPQTDAVKQQLAAALAMAAEIRTANTADPQKLLMGVPAAYWADINSYDQVETMKRVKLPVLILQGERDYNVTMTDFEIWKTQLKGRKNISFLAYPKLNHSFIEGTGKGTPAELQQPGNVPAYVADDIVKFIQQK